MIDWTKPIEAVHTDGRVQPVTLERFYANWHDIEPRLDSGYTYSFTDDGTHARSDWTIRNVQQPTASDEATRRMTALIERIIAGTTNNGDGELMLTAVERAVVAEARAIAALLAPPVDPRLALVVSALVQNGIGKPVAPLFARDVLKALDA